MEELSQILADLDALIGRLQTHKNNVLMQRRLKDWENKNIAEAELQLLRAASFLREISAF